MVKKFRSGFSGSKTAIVVPILIPIHSPLTKYGPLHQKVDQTRNRGTTAKECSTHHDESKVTTTSSNESRRVMFILESEYKIDFELRTWRLNLAR